MFRAGRLRNQGIRIFSWSPGQYFFEKILNTIHPFQESENLICVTEDKVQRSILEGFAQNIKQLESSYETNKKKRKRADDDDFDYLYGIVTSARDWYFLLYSPGEISQASEVVFRSVSGSI